MNHSDGSEPGTVPLLSLIILNRNGKAWLQRCFDSIRAQTVFDRIEVVFADNASTDGSAEFAEETLREWPNGVFVQNGANLGFCEGNNRAARHARGTYVMFINEDMWLEPDCLEKLLGEREACRADAATPVILDYDDDHFQGIGATGLDILGMSNASGYPTQTVDLFAIPGGSCLIRRELFLQVGGFDSGHFMYCEEPDLCWRVHLAGGRMIGVPAARIHHRTPPRDTGAQTTERKRFLTTRNNLLMLLKNSQHLFFLLIIPQVMFRLAEALGSVVLLRRWSFVREVFWAALKDVWRMRGHVREWRRRIRTFRRRGDFWMLRFLRLKPVVLHDIRRAIRHGSPKVDR